LVTNQQQSWAHLKELSTQWQNSLNKRVQNFFKSSLNSLDLIQKETKKINSNFQKLSSLSINTEWGFIYSRVEDYFDKEAIEQFSINLNKQSENLERKFNKEKMKMINKFRKISLFDKIQTKLKEEGVNKLNKLEPINRDKFQMLEELSQGIRNGESANKE
jgi:BMFP domain-containing protein YqiC